MVKVCLWLTAILAINIWDVQALEAGSEIGTPGLNLKSLSISTLSSMNGESGTYYKEGESTAFHSMLVYLTPHTLFPSW